MCIRDRYQRRVHGDSIKFKMVKKYAREPALPAKTAKARGQDLRVHFKNTYETAKAVKGLTVARARSYLRDVLAHKRCVPFTRYRNHVGRSGQALEFGLTQGRWPQKSVKIILGLLQNLESNANVKNLDVKKLVISHIQVNKAPKGRRRTYRAHGRINPYLSSNTHIELWATEKQEDVRKEARKVQETRLTKRQAARQRLRVGEGK
eukprot:TRINITY_DN19462_c0_g1_i1.p1 TRINITY_DN19462_c0_g1~~TRINITY_DN19462_c0_g1_i1.p1  ORF type:complete len:206 (-),score=66.62 TRINITY_DN19462_c0_g1_i1:132-749(-)